MNNKFENKNKLYESEDTIPTFDVDIDVLELLHDATIMGLDDEENEIPGYVFADSLASMIGMSTEDLIEFAKENGYEIYTAHINGEELPADLFVICASGCDLETIKADYREIYEVELELRPVKDSEEDSEEPNPEPLKELNPEPMKETYTYASPSEETIEKFLNLLKTGGYEISSSEKYRSLFGDDKSYSVHIQIVSKKSNFTKETFEKEFDRISGKIQKFDPDRRFHITYNFGLMKDGHITAGLDIRPEEIEDKKIKEEVENNKLEKHWIKEDGTPVEDFVCMTNEGEKDFYDKYWTQDGFHFTVWLRDGRPEGIISDAETQNWAFDNYPDDEKYDGLEFDVTDDGAIFFKADYNMSPEDVLDALKTIANESEYLQKHVGKDDYDSEDDDSEDDEDRYHDQYGDDFDEEEDELNEENELQKTARRHKKTDKKGSKGAFVNPNAGDVEKNVAFFNKALGNETSTADGGIGEVSMGESLEQFELVKLEGETRQQFVERFMIEKEEKFPKPKERYQSALECWEKQK